MLLSMPVECDLCDGLLRNWGLGRIGITDSSVHRPVGESLSRFAEALLPGKGELVSFMDMGARLLQNIRSPASVGNLPVCFSFSV